MLHDKNIQLDLCQPLLAKVKICQRGEIRVGLINKVCADDNLYNNVISGAKFM